MKRFSPIAVTCAVLVASSNAHADPFSDAKYLSFDQSPSTAEAPNFVFDARVGAGASQALTLQEPSWLVNVSLRARAAQYDHRADTGAFLTPILGITGQLGDRDIKGQVDGGVAYYPIPMHSLYVYGGAFVGVAQGKPGLLPHGATYGGTAEVGYGGRSVKRPLSLALQTDLGHTNIPDGIRRPPPANWVSYSLSVGTLLAVPGKR